MSSPFGDYISYLSSALIEKETSRFQDMNTLEDKKKKRQDADLTDEIVSDGNLSASS